MISTLATVPDRVGPVYAMVQDALRQEAGISIHVGKTRIWNKAGLRPWRVPRVPVEEKGMKIFGHPDRPPRMRSQILALFVQ